MLRGGRRNLTEVIGAVWLEDRRVSVMKLGYRTGTCTTAEEALPLPSPLVDDEDEDEDEDGKGDGGDKGVVVVVDACDRPSVCVAVSRRSHSTRLPSSEAASTRKGREGCTASEVSVCGHARICRGTSGRESEWRRMRDSPVSDDGVSEDVDIGEGEEEEAEDGARDCAKSLNGLCRADAPVVVAANMFLLRAVSSLE